MRVVGAGASRRPRGQRHIHAVMRCRLRRLVLLLVVMLRRLLLWLLRHGINRSHARERHRVWAGLAQPVTIGALLRRRRRRRCSTVMAVRSRLRPGVGRRRGRRRWRRRGPGQIAHGVVRSCRSRSRSRSRRSVLWWRWRRRRGRQRAGVMMATVPVVVVQYIHAGL